LNEALQLFVQKLHSDPRAPTSVTDPAEARNVHIADALAGLEVPQLATATRIADVGSGAGLPGIVLAASLPRARVDLIESAAKKCAFMQEALAETGIANARVIAARSEDWAATSPPDGGREAYEAVTIRAVGSLATDAELASPLLRAGGVLVVWKGARRAAEEAGVAAAVPELGMELADVMPVAPYPGSRNRHIYVLRKAGPTPDGLPRRPGLAAKRPLGARRGVG
jgi:16S rRNA (guanine527-N7)-methyltransferase